MSTETDLRELVERLAREAELPEENATHCRGGVLWYHARPSQLRRFAALVAEECAKVCDSKNHALDNAGNFYYRPATSNQCAAAIRERFSLAAPQQEGG